MELSVIKRDGTRTAFNPMKIEQAICKAVKSTTGTEHPELTLAVTHDVCKKIYARDTNTISVEDIQDLVENQLIEYNEAAIAKKYILYRQKRSEIREMNSSIFQAISQYIAVTPTALDDDKRENANINADSTSGAMLKIGSTANKTYSLCKLISPKYAQMHREGKLHIHDLDYLNLTINCLYLPADQLLKNGFGTGHGSLRPPTTIGTAATQIAIMIQSDQNDCFNK